MEQPKSDAVASSFGSDRATHDPAWVKSRAQIDRMNKWFSAFRKLSQAAFLLALAASTVLVTQAGITYLAKTGPVPLRWEAVSATDNPFVLPPLAMEESTPTNAESVEALAPSTQSATNSEPSAQVAAQVASPTIPVSIVTTTAPGEDLSTAVAPMPYPSASDLLGVSPQMLAEYFKPIQNGTNLISVPVVLPPGVGFIPPTPAPGAPSRATYRSQ